MIPYKNVSFKILTNDIKLKCPATGRNDADSNTKAGKIKTLRIKNYLFLVKLTQP